MPDVKEQIEELAETLYTTEIEWTSWEEEFIRNMHQKLNYASIYLSPKQSLKLDALWEKLQELKP